MATKYDKEKIKECLSNIPITINTHFGDPFQPTQWENTLSKLRYLKQQDYQGEVEVCSKWILTDEQIETLHSVNPDIWVYCGITGLNEMDIPLDVRFDNYLRICKKFKKTVISVRPLIPGKNMSIDKLKPIIEVASNGCRYLHHGGYLDPLNHEKGKANYDTLKEDIRKACKEKKVIDAPRCSCLVEYVTGKVDSTFAETVPSNLDVLSALGYKYELVDGYVKLLGYKESNTITKGDVSFARLIILSSRILPNWTDFHVNMQMRGPNGQMMFCTSSWFHWAREVKCKVNCFYCHVRPGTPIFIKSGDSGCSPIDLYNALFEEN